jgi:hypothetical protein
MKIWETFRMENKKRKRKLTVKIIKAPPPTGVPVFWA